MEDLEIVNYNTNSVEDILTRKGARYSVSFFQRDYSWGKDEWSALFDDIVASLEEKRKHFFGFMTFFKPPSSSEEIQIIEGQQRLATVTILASVVRDLFIEHKNDDWKKVDDAYVKPQDIYSKESYEKLVLSDINGDFFKKYIQKEGKPKEKIDSMKTEKKLKSSNRLIRDCYIYFHEKLKNEHFLLEILRKVTREFIEMTSEVKNLRSAYILFQTLNDRGLDLTLSDLLKTHLLQKAGDEWKDIKKEWDNILNLPSIDNMNVFLRHYWLSTRGIVKEEELFDKFSGEVENKEQATKFVIELKREAEIYSALLDAKPVDFDGNKQVVEILKNELYVLSKQQVLPLLLALRQKFKPKQIEKVITSLTSFIFRYLTIGEQENKELERLFSDISRKIRDDKIKNASSVVRELKKKYIKDETFKELFKNKQIKDNKKAVYILTKIEQSLSGQEEKFASDITLEHILPVNPSDDCRKYMIQNKLWDDRDEWVYRIGNMTLLLGKINRKAQNKSPLAKSKEIYNKDTKLEINKPLKNLTKWTAKEIEQRQDEFAERAVQIWKL